MEHSHVELGSLSKNPGFSKKADFSSSIEDLNLTKPENPKTGVMSSRLSRCTQVVSL